MRIGFVMQGPKGPHRVWSAVGQRLAERGAQVEFLFPDTEIVDLNAVRIEHDLYVLKATSGFGLSYAGALHAAGAAILNPYPVAALCRDKIVTSHVLAAGGVPTPETWVAANREQLHTLLEGGPIVVKPHQGSRGLGVEICHAPADIDALALDGGLLFVQRYHAPDGSGLDYKMYVIDGEVFCVRRVWPSVTWEDKMGRPFAPSSEIREIAHRCAAAIGADTFGFDIVFSEDQPYVVDLSGFPGFKGVPNNIELLANAVEGAARRVLAGEPVVIGAAGRPAHTA